MLVLSRFNEQKIRIGDDIEILVVRAENGKVRLGITAPREMPIHRDELYQQLKTAGVEVKSFAKAVSE